MTFPSSILRSGAITQRPYTSQQSYWTTKVTLENGVSYSWYNRSVSLNHFQLNFLSMTASELATLENFFASCEGRLQSFDMVDPDGTHRPYCRFDSDELVISYVGPGEYAVVVPIVEFSPS